MKISKIHIENFRSIKTADIEASDFNVFVGRNNHGKTNIFDAIEWFYSGKGDLNELRTVDAEADAEIVVEITFTNVQEGINHISNEENQTKLKNILKESDAMRLRRTSKTGKDRFLWNPEKQEWKKQPCGVDTAFNNCIPRFEFVEATKHLKDVSGCSTKSPIGQMLGGVLTEILEKDQTYRDFRKAFETLFQSEGSGIQAKLKELSGQVKGHLQQQFPDCNAVRFAVEEPQFDDLLKNFSTKVDDGVETDATKKGDGMQRALMLAIIKTHADFRRQDALGKAFIFFIDEAELHLHPSAQRQLKSVLVELSQSVDQVFINTHSSVLIVDEHERQNIFCVDKSEGTTAISKLSEVGKQDVVYQLLGGNPADLLLPANFLIVEGQSEQLFLERVVGRLYADKPIIQIVPALGDHERQEKSMEGINLVFKPLAMRPIYKMKLAILCDKSHADKQANFDLFKAQNAHLEQNGQLYVLPVDQLEDYYPKRPEWTIPQNPTGKQKKKWAKKIGNEITKEEFENSMPVVLAALTATWEKAYV